MADTFHLHMGSSLPKSSDFNKNVWMDLEPKELIQGGYADAIDFAPLQAQSAVEVETTTQSINDSKQIAPTAVASRDGVIVQLRIPDQTPDTRNWVTMHALQEWEGFILSRGEEEFVARLRDLTAESLASKADQLMEEEAIIPLAEIADEDSSRIQPGNVLSVGHRIPKNCYWNQETCLADHLQGPSDHY